MGKSFAIAAPTGIVGKELVQLIEKSFLPLKKIRFYGSDRSQGKKIYFRKKKYSIQPLSKATFQGDDLIFFCTPSDVSRKYIPLAQPKVEHIIDLSSAFRQDPLIPLIVPEVNGDKYHGASLICSPNCVASIALVALYPLHIQFELAQVIISTYQALSGGGRSLMENLCKDTQNFLKNPHAPPLSAFNVYLHHKKEDDELYSEEERKIAFEIGKILQLPHLKVSVQAVRIPSLRVHSLSMHCTFTKKVCVEKAKKILSEAPGMRWIEKPYLLTSNFVSQKTEVFCTRIRKASFCEYTLEFWVSADQLLKGAAWNALQIAELIYQNHL